MLHVGSAVLTRVELEKAGRRQPIARGAIDVFDERGYVVGLLTHVGRALELLSAVPISSRQHLVL
jgi:hypothetical protein